MVAWTKAAGFAVFFGFSCSAWAGLYFETNIHYSTDTFVASTTNSFSKTLYDVVLGFSMENRGKYILAWNYTGSAATETIVGIPTTFSSTDMGPKFVWFFNNARSWSLGLAYNISSTAAYNTNNGTAEKWLGTVMKADLGYNFWIGESTAVGPRLTYSAASYTSQIVGAVYTQSAFTRTTIYPSIYLALSF